MFALHIWWKVKFNARGGNEWKSEDILPAMTLKGHAGSSVQKRTLFFNFIPAAVQFVFATVNPQQHTATSAFFADSLDA